MVVDTREPQVLNPAGGMALQELRLLRKELRDGLRRLEIASRGEQQDIFMLPFGPSTQKISISDIVIVGGAVEATYFLQIGSWNAIAFRVGGAGTPALPSAFPFPHVIQPGTRVTVVVAATGAEASIGVGGALITAYIVGTSLEADSQPPYEADNLSV